MERYVRIGSVDPMDGLLLYVDVGCAKLEVKPWHSAPDNYNGMVVR